MPLLNVTHNTVFKVTPTQSFLLPATAKWSINAGLTFEYNHAFRVGQHCWIKLKYPIGTIGRTGYFYLPHVEASVNELRGVWLTNIDSNILHSRNQIEEGLQQLKQLGFNKSIPQYGKEDTHYILALLQKRLLVGLLNPMRTLAIEICWQN